MSRGIIKPLESLHGRGKVHIGFERKTVQYRVSANTACGQTIVVPKPENDTGEVNCPECLHALGLLTNSGEPTP